MFILRLRQKRFVRILSVLLAIIFVVAVAIPMNYNVMAVDSSVTTLNVSTLWDKKRAELGWYDVENNVNVPKDKMWQKLYGTDDTENEIVPITVVTADTVNDNIKNTLGRKISGTLSYNEVKITPYSYTYQGGNQTPALNSKITSATSVGDGLDLYYTIDTDSSLGGEYRRYYVSTANQLATLLWAYQNSSGSKIKAQAAETDSKKDGINKVGITLLNDIDLGGADGNAWYGFLNKNFVLDIDGQGHNIYNGYFPSSNYCFLGRSGGSCDNKFSIRNVTFSHMFIPRVNGIFGGDPNGWRIQYAYFENVDFEYCMAVTSANATSIVLGGHYAYCYIKDCTIRNSYVKGNGHSSTFATYNPEEVGDRNISYLDDDTSGIESYYYTTIPDLEEAECAWNGYVSKKEGYENKKLSAKFPTIYENCAVIDCEVYDTDQHSGAFFSCQSGYIICRNCFTNSTIYGDTRTGVFFGACMGAGDGFYSEVDGKREFTNSVFENCYASGSVEGKQLIGGFVGVVFNDKDKRPNLTADRGKVVFKNCYSTSAVGLQYASTAGLGGFVGDVVGNSMGTDEKLAPEDERAHIFINCYAAGEVGNILTCTDTVPTGGETTPSQTKLNINNNNAVGGFMGTYYTEYPEMDIKNCYYDKQTTAMRERFIGCAVTRNSNMTINKTTKTQLYDKVKGITGAYTKASTAKNVVGLTDTPNIMGDTDAWTYQTDYYPQLANFTDSQYLTEEYKNGNLIDKMKYERALLYKRCSFASTATVFLDHYDEMLDESGNSVSAIDQGVYDTVRDITSKFEFTSTCDDEIEWSVDKERNDNDGFPSKLIGADSTGFTMTYGSNTEGVADTYDKVCSPSVLTIDEVDNVFKCFDFAPGKQWVRVDVSALSGDDDFVGTRWLRLLPMAYLNAGDIISVKVKANDVTTYGIVSTVWTNEVYYNDSSENNIMTTQFNHSYGVVYAITERARQLGTEYNNQIIRPYTDVKNTKIDDYFALYGGYLLSEAMCNKVWLNTDGKMFEQKFDKLKDDNNQSKNGLTMVRVFRTIPTKNGQNKAELIQGEEIDMTNADTRSKWEGDIPFTSKEAGYYYMRYYWRFDDGRYLEDVKLVYISESNYNVEAVTGILNNPHTVDDTVTDGLKSPIDQYVSPKKVDDSEVLSVYPSADADFNNSNASEYYNYFTDEYTYNAKIKFDDGGTYYVKSDSLVTSSKNTTVGWHYTDDYKMTTLIVEAHDAYDNKWHEMARVDADEVKARSRFDFNNAEYQYNFVTYNVTQDKETKLFTVATQYDNEATFTVETYGIDSGYATDQYITFAFGNEQDTTLADINDDLRVTVLFRNVTADVSGEKSVLLETGNLPTDWTEDTAYAPTDGTYAKSLRVGEAYKSVDNAGLANDERKAVLPGSILTYRVYLKNEGFDDALNVVVTDTVPKGCTFVADSQRIYRQYKDITGGTVKYGSLERLDNDEYSKCVVSYNRGALTWGIPIVNLEYDYYVEYRAVVDETSYSYLASNTVSNTASFSYDKNASVSYIDLEEEDTNTVETDVGWMYMIIKKEIPVNDPAQTFLFRIDYYDSDTATKPSATFYTDINCTDKSESDGVYVGNSLIQCAKAGKYVVTEMDWSSTDYDFGTAYYQANATAKKTSVSGKSVTVIPASNSSENGSFLTASAINPGEYAPVVTFTSNESKYAYGSSQARVENGFVIE